MPLLQEAMNHHFGQAGVIFTSIALWLFSFSTFIGILYYARSNVAYLFGNSWKAQTIYKIVALMMLFVGGLATYTFVWELGDISVALMTVFNLIAIIPMGGQAIQALKDYQKIPKDQR
jgi:AGCS family alanine or glycine:cation symporter